MNSSARTIPAWLCAIAAPALLAVAFTSSAADDQALFRLNGLDFAPEDLPMPVQQALYDLRLTHYRNLSDLLDGAALQMQLEEEAEKKGVSKEVLSAEILAVPPPAEEEMRAFYEANRERIRATYEQIKPRLQQLMQNQASQQKARAYVTGLQQEGKYEPLLSEPRAPSVTFDFAGAPSKGGDAAPVTIVEFADYQCPHCKEASSVLSKIVDRYDGQVRLVYKDFPISPEGVSRRVAEGAVCAHEQGRFWEYHDLAFAKQKALTSDSAVELAGELSLDADVFAECMSSGRAQQRVSRSRTEANSLGVTSTPTIFVNGRRVVIEDFERDISLAVEKALGKATS